MDQASSSEPSSRDRILAAATRLFASLGVAGTSVQAVADEVGIRKASLLYHFESKEALRQAVLDALLAGWKDVFPRLLMAASTGKDRFDSVIGEVLAFFEADPNRARLLLREGLSRPDELRELLREHMQPWMGLMTGFMERGMEEGRVHADLDPLAFIHEMVLLVSSHFALVEVGGAAAPGRADDADWTRRRTDELKRIARTALFRQRPAGATSDGES
jgi:TetR/AcrR family transcriptional regulator